MEQPRIAWMPDIEKTPRQTRLPLSREDRFALLRAIDPASLAVDEKPVGRRTWANVVDLVMQVEFCTARDGCFAYAETLAARMAGGVGVSRATFFRARSVAVAVGVVEAEHRHGRSGQQSNAWRVRWDRVQALSKSQLRLTETHPSQARGKTETAPSQIDTAPSQLAQKKRATETLPLEEQRGRTRARATSVPTSERNPPLPPARLASHAAASLAASWKGAGDVLIRLGMGGGRAAALAVSDAGGSPDDVERIVAFWKSNADCWDVGGLYLRLMRWQPGQKPSEHWPRSVKFERAEQRRKSQFAYERDQERKMRQAASDAEARLSDAEHRRQWASRVAALSDGEVRVMLADNLALLKHFNASGRTGNVQVWLAWKLSETAQPA